MMDDLPDENNVGESTTNSEVSDDKNTSPTIGTELHNFIEQISSLFMTLGLTVSALLKENKKIDQITTATINERKSYEDPESKKTKSELIDFIYKQDNILKQQRIMIQSLKTVPRTYLMTLMSHYDAFLGKMIKFILLAKPELINSSEKNLSLAQLMEFGSIKSAKDFILEKEIESVLRKSHTEQFTWMESKFSIPLRKDLDIWSDFIEITERRNLYVHTGGIVSSQYLKVCKENGVALNNVALGDELPVDAQYFQHAFDVIFELAFKLTHVLWRKFLPDQLQIADSNLIEIGYEEGLVKENYDLAKMVFNFGTQTIKKHGDEEHRLIMTINKALAYKWSSDQKRAEQIISHEDWSATMNKFKLAAATIRDEYDTVYDLMKEIGKDSNEIIAYNYRTWSLFKLIKKEPKFLEIFEQIYGEPYGKLEVSSVILPKNSTPNIE